MKVAVTNVLHRSDIEAIFSGRTEAGDMVVVKISKPIMPVRGAVYEVSAEPYVAKDKWKRQQLRVDAERIELVKPSGRLCIPWLEGLKGVGPTRAKRLLDRFGDTVIEILRDPSSVSKIAKAIEPHRPAIGNVLAVQLQVYFFEREATDNTADIEWKFYRKLESMGIDNHRVIKRLWRLMGASRAQDRLMTNPYVGSIILPWKAADLLGQLILTEQEYDGDPLVHPDRLSGACDAAWRRLLSRGNTAATEDEFKLAMPRGVSASAALEAGISAHAVVKSGDLLRAPGAAWLEDELARHLRRVGSPSDSGALKIPEDLTTKIQQMEHECALRLTDEQRRAVLQLLRWPLGTLQGGAGTGKSTTAKVLANMWETFGGEVVICTPTGKTAHELSRMMSTSRKTRIVHTVAQLLQRTDRALPAAKEGEAASEGLPKLKNNTLLIINDASTLSTPLLHRLVSRIPDGARLLLVGDRAQLPPVGIGSVFHDLVDLGGPVANLTEILCKKKDFPIPHTAALVRNGIVPVLEPLGGIAKGVFHFECSSEGVKESLYKIWNRLGCNNFDLVCAALRSTLKIFNSFMTARHGGQVVRLSSSAWVAPGDPVVCTRDHYEDQLYNGMLGIIDRIDNGAYVLWDGEDELRLLSEEVAEEIELAYAVTCHKCQGSYARRVIIPLEESQLMTREWLYTAITRAREQVILVGPKQALESAIGRRTVRSTGFKWRFGT